MGYVDVLVHIDDGNVCHIHSPIRTGNVIKASRTIMLHKTGKLVILSEPIEITNSFILFMDSFLHNFANVCNVGNFLAVSDADIAF